jgi:hypothetical protein
MWIAELRQTMPGEEATTGQTADRSQFTKRAVSRSGRLGEKGGGRGPHQEFPGGRVIGPRYGMRAAEPDPSEMVSVGIACSGGASRDAHRRGQEGRAKNVGSGGWKSRMEGSGRTVSDRSRRV